MPVHRIARFYVVYLIEQRHPRERHVGAVFVERVRVGFQLRENGPPVYLLPVLVREFRVEALKRQHL